MTWMRGLGSTEQSGHASGLHIRDHSVCELATGRTRRSKPAAGEAVGLACETHLLCVSLQMRTELSSTMTELETTGFSNDQGVRAHHVHNQLSHYYKSKTRRESHKITEDKSATRYIWTE